MLFIMLQMLTRIHSSPLLDHLEPRSISDPNEELLTSESTEMFFVSEQPDLDIVTQINA